MILFFFNFISMMTFISEYSNCFIAAVLSSGVVVLGKLLFVRDSYNIILLCYMWNLTLHGNRVINSERG